LKLSGMCAGGTCTCTGKHTTRNMSVLEIRMCAGEPYSRGNISLELV